MSVGAEQQPAEVPGLRAIAERNARPDADQGMRGGDEQLLARVVIAGADLNEVDSDMTPLLWAILGGYLDAVKVLLESGADPNVKPNPTDSPLWSAEDDFGMTAMAELLKSYGAQK